MKNKIVIDDLCEFVGKDGDEYPEKIIAFYWHSEKDKSCGEYVINRWKDGRITASTEAADWGEDKPVFLKTLINLAKEKYPEKINEIIKIESEIDKVIIRN